MNTLLLILTIFSVNFASADSKKETLEILMGMASTSLETLEKVIQEDRPNQEICMELGSVKQAFFSLQAAAPKEIQYRLYGEPIVAMEGYCVTGEFKSGEFEGVKRGSGLAGWLQYENLDDLKSNISNIKEGHWTIKNMLNGAKEAIANME